MYTLRNLTYAQVQEQFPKAWTALPSSYQNDNCLAFSLDSDGDLWADHDLDGEYLWNPDKNEWMG